MKDAYRDAGVDIAAGNEAVERMKRHVATTLRPEVLGGLGGFGGMFALGGDRYRDPVLVSGADGVGTKLKLAFEMDRHDTIGIDAVAMCINDIATSGAEPLFFLDYLACDRVVPERIEAIVAGVADGCRQAGCALLGGETAEMPGMYQPGEYDIAGFAVGVVERDRIVDGAGIRAGDVVLGVPSSGLHSNGFSLVRKLLADRDRFPLHEPLDGFHDPRPLGEVLLQPTRIYVTLIAALLAAAPVRGFAHVTGGGLIENVPRILPDGLGVALWRGSWPVSEIFGLLAREGGLTEDEMHRTFNMGIGLVAIARPEDVAGLTAAAERAGATLHRIGVVTDRATGVSFVGDATFPTGGPA